MLTSLILAAALMAVDGNVVYQVTPPGSRDLVIFYDSQGKCPEGTLETRWAVRAGPRAGIVVEGCYMVQGETVYMKYDDGDKYVVPLSVLQELHEKGKNAPGNT